MEKRLHGLLAARPIVAAIMLAMCLPGTAALAEPDNQAADNANIEALSIVSEDFAGPLRWMAEDLASVLSGNDTLRVLPIFGVGGNGTAPEILYLKSMDVAFIHSDFLAYAKRHGLHSDLDNRLRYITRLYDKDVAIIAAKPVRDVRQLAGRKVNFDNATSSSFATSALIFDLLGIDVEKVQFSQPIAMEKVRAGEIAATVLVDDKPNRLIATLVAEHGLRLVPIRLTRALRGAYQPTKFTSQDYPNLIPAGQSVDSVGVSVVMAMYNWPPNSARYGRVARFVEQFFSNVPGLQAEPHHPHWKKVDIAAALPGWTRFKPAADWIERQQTPAARGGAMAKLREMFQKFIELQAAGSDQAITEEEKTALFKLFLGWKENPDEANIEIRMTALDGKGKPIGFISAKNIAVTVSGSSQVGLLLKPDLAGLPPGSHALQIHARPDCGPEQKNGALVIGLAAGNPLQLVRQSQAAGSNPGGLPPLIVAADGTSRDRIIVPGLSLADLLDRSIMIYASGSATSDRIACGVVD